MKLCNKCVQFISDQENVCEECKTYNPDITNWKEKENEFQQVFEQFNGTGEKYDFIVPFTGGKDSSFVLQYMVKKLGARVLALAWDNGLIREKSWDNIHTITKNLNVDLHVVKWDEEKLRKLFHATFIRYSKVCYCPFFVFLASLEVALTNKIPAVITGFSEGQREMDHSFKLSSYQEQKINSLKTISVWETFFGVALKVYQNDDISGNILHEFFGKINSINNSLPEDTIYPYFIPLSNYVNWTSFGELEQMLNETGWKNPAKTVSHSSCYIEPIKGYIEAKRNLNELRSEISHMIRCGGITRAKGVEELNAINLSSTTLPETTEQFCDFIYIDKTKFIESTTKENPVYPTEELKQKADQLKTNLLNSITWIMGVSHHKAKFY